jgi:uncharacterized phosphosugar-binding protein
MEGSSLSYLGKIRDALNEVETQELVAINKAGILIGQTMSEGKVFHVFGSGHSDLIASDCFARAGGLACANKITDPTRGQAERVEGFIAPLMEKYDLRSGEVIIIISNSGRNAAPIEAALYAKSCGLTVVAITSLSHSKEVSSRHSSSKKLYELADIVIDTHGPLGDACIELQSGIARVGAVSTVLGATILNMILVCASRTCLELCGEVPILSSLNLDGTDKRNRNLWLKYSSRIGPSEF